MQEKQLAVNEEDLARCLWTIGDVTRLKILQLLPTTPDCCEGKNVSQLAEELELTQSTISNHLARLRTLGIVRNTKQCRDVYYWIDPERAEQIEAQLQAALKLGK
jgi:ArsR family transcriptional regulator